MFTFTVNQTSNKSGAGVLVVKCNGKQKTTRYNPALSEDQNRFGAVGNLANVILSPEQQAKVRHPSGGQRVRVQSLSDGGGKHRVSIDV